jgi:hypothetical protein
MSCETPKPYPSSFIPPWILKERIITLKVQGARKKTFSICVNPNAELNPTASPNYSAGYLNFAHDIRKTWIFRELSGINLWNKNHFVGKETYIAQCAFKFCNLLITEWRRIVSGKKTCKYPCSFTYIVIEASTVCNEDGRKDVISYFLCGNPQNNFGPHKAPRHTWHIWTSLFASRPSPNTCNIAVSCYCSQASAYCDMCPVFQCC